MAAAMAVERKAVVEPTYYYYSHDFSYVGYAVEREGMWNNYTRGNHAFGIPRPNILAAHRDATRFFECGIKILKGEGL